MFNKFANKICLILNILVSDQRIYFCIILKNTYLECVVETKKNCHSETILLSIKNTYYLNIFLKGYPLEAKTAPKK